MRHLFLIVALASTGLLPGGGPARATAPRQVEVTVADPVLANRLQTEATRRLREEFANQPARLDIEQVQVRRAGDYLALLADGHADFGVEGRPEATVRAMYDPRNGRWLRLDYDLGNDDGGS